jgi:hypothetical protein
MEMTPEMERNRGCFWRFFSVGMLIFLILVYVACER